MKTSINTLNGYFNYGNRLQLFALSQILGKLVNEVSVYWPQTKKDLLKKYIKYRSPLSLIFKKETKIYNFTKKHLPIIDNKSQKDYSVVGSDQVWNPNYLQSRPYLLDTVNCNATISYAASMGVETLTAKQREIFANILKKYKAVSVRETTAKKLLQPLTDKKIKVVLDPTLLLDEVEYERLEKKPKNLKEDEKYILCYILGDREHQSTINNFANKHNYKVILFSDKKDSNYGVEEFLYLIHHAQLICTDSFHACVFSFIFERPFVAFKRTGEANYMYSRLQNLIDTFHLENREFNGEEITKGNLKVDYSEAKKILKKEQEKSIKFLKGALDITEKSDG